MNKTDRLAFITTIGSEFCEALDGFVNSDYLDPHEAIEPITTVFGMNVTQNDLKNISVQQLEKLVTEYNNYFETNTITNEIIRETIDSILYR